MPKYVSENQTAPEIYHTEESCPKFPEDERLITSDDTQSGIRECLLCQSERVLDELELES